MSEAPGASTPRAGRVGGRTPAPAIVLVGGEMTLEDGSTLSSCQPVEGDDMAKVPHSALIGSALWWATVASLVGPILDYCGEASYALFVGPRSAVEPTGDGKLRRVRVRSLLPGATGTVDLSPFDSPGPLPEGYVEIALAKEVAQSEHGQSEQPGPGAPWGQGGPVSEADADGARAWDRPPPASERRLGMRFRDERARWQFLNGNTYYLSQAGPAIRPSVLVSTTVPDLVNGAYSAYFVDGLEQQLTYGENLVLVLPDTHFTHQGVEAFVRRRHGVATDRPPPTITPENFEGTREPRVIPAVAAASFGVTGFVRTGNWQDAGALEAARRLLAARYDLQIGIWDLVDNATLRDALLEQVELPHPKGAVAPIPETARRRAQQAKGRREQRKHREQEALNALDARFGPLRELGWERWSPEGSVWSLDLTERVQRWWDDKPFPLVRLELDVGAHRTTVSVFSLLYNQLNLPAYAQLHKSELVAIAGDGAAEFDATRAPALWKVSGGWDDPVDWAERATFIATRTRRWKAVLEEFCEATRRAHVANPQSAPANAPVVTIRMPTE